MTYFEALYGSQYNELNQMGKDGNKGRLNGNVFLSAFIFLCLLVVIAILAYVSKMFISSPGVGESHNFGNLSGRAVGRLLAIPVFGLIYFIIIKTVGNEENFKKTVASFLKYPEEQRKKANSRLLLPFFVVLGLLVIFMLLN